MTELWKDIKDFEGCYQVSNLGNVRSLNRTCCDGRRLKGNVMKMTVRSGYYNIILCKNNTRYSFQIHRLVASEFLENKSNYNVVNHKDYNTKNNIVENLEWCSTKQNVNYSKDRMKKRKSITNSNSGEKYIHYRKLYNNYEVTVSKIYLGKFKTIEEAKVARNKYLED